MLTAYMSNVLASSAGTLPFLLKTFLAEEPMDESGTLVASSFECPLVDSGAVGDEVCGRAVETTQGSRFFQCSIQGTELG